MSAVHAISAATGPRQTLHERLDTLFRLLKAEAEAGDASAVVSPASWQALEASGLKLAPFPAMVGGEDLGLADTDRELTAVLAGIGASDLSVARLFEGHVNAVHLVVRYGTQSQISDLAAAVRDGALCGVWAAEGSQKLTGTKRGDAWRLTGGKILASGAGIVTRPLVPVATEAGSVLMLLALGPDTPVDLSGWTAQGMRSSATGTIDLTGQIAHDDQVVGQPGDFMRQPAFSGGAWRFCAVHLGAAERLVDLFRDSLLAANRADDPFQLQRVAQAVAAVTTARFWVDEAARRLAENTDPAGEIVAFANLTRMVTERAALDVLELVHRGVGLRGFMRPHPIERITRDLSTYLRQPVPDLAMADAARTVLALGRPMSTLWETPA